MREAGETTTRRDMANTSTSTVTGNLSPLLLTPSTSLTPLSLLLSFSFFYSFINLLSSRYEGEFRRDLKDGPGRYYFSDGTVEEGTWESDKRRK